MFSIMKPFLSSRRRDQNRATRPKNRAKPMLEAMEGRNLMTVVFTPNFGTETIAPGSKNNGLQSPPVYVIYQGDYFTTAAGQQDEARITAAVRSIVTGPYLSGLTQYGSDGKATFGGSYTIDNNINNATGAKNQPFSGSDLAGFVQRDINNKLVPSPTPTTHTPIYIVVTDPNAISKTPGAAGYNIPNPGAIHAIWASTQWASGQVGKQIDLDTLTQIISHELAETITDPDGNGVAVNASNSFPASLLPLDSSNNPTRLGQIGDFEPDGRAYQYRLNGYQVQPYFSAADKAFIVPDGNTERFQLVPLWYMSTFSGAYQLNAGIDRTGAYTQGDRFLVNAGGPSNQGTSVYFDGQSVAFDQGRLATIHLSDTFSATAATPFLINNVEPGQTVTVVTSGTNDNVSVGNGNVAGIRGTVNVSNDSGTNTRLFVDDSYGSQPHHWTVKPGSIGFDNQGVINFGAYPGTSGGLASETLSTSLASSTVDVEGVGTEPFTLDDRRGLATLTGPAASKVHVFYEI